MEPYDIRPAIVTNWMKVLMTFIDRVGFPIIVCAALFWQLEKERRTIETLTLTIIQLQQEIHQLNSATSELKQNMLIRGRP